MKTNPSEQLVNDIPALVLSLGEESFGSKLFDFIHKLVDAEHVTVFYLVCDKLHEIIAVSYDGSSQAHEQASKYVSKELWRKDPTLDQARKKLDEAVQATVRTDIAHLPDRKLRDEIYRRSEIHDRVLICGRTSEGIIGISLLRSMGNGSFTEDELARVQSVADPLFALLTKHINVTVEGPSPVIALTSLAEIEQCLKDEIPSMPRREVEVCSRAIYGVFNLGISMELGIGEETVVTYRKRAYNRLGVATQHELLLKYLQIWSEWQNHKQNTSVK